MQDLYSEMKRQLYMKMRFMDPTIKGATESLEYKEASAYNAGIRDAISVLDSYREMKMD